MRNDLITTVIIVNWNSAEDSISCIKSIMKTSCFNKSVNIIVVDNNSKDSSLDSINAYLMTNNNFISDKQQDNYISKRINKAIVYKSNEKFINKIVLISANKNYGFSGGNNIGLIYADNNFNSDYYWILNNDTLVEPNTLLLMLKRIQKNKQICICGSTILQRNDKSTVQCYGGSYYSLFSGRGWSFNEGEKYSKNITNGLAESKLNYISGASMLLKASFIKKIGWFCEDYFLYNEEIDLSMKLTNGEKLAVATDAVVYHKIGATIGTNHSNNNGSKLASFYQSRSKLIFAKKHTPKNYIFVYFFILGRCLKFFLVKKSISNGLIILSVLLGRKEPNKDWFVR